MSTIIAVYPESGGAQAVSPTNPVPVYSTAEYPSVVDAGKIRLITASAFTRPSDTTTYAVGDLIANSTTAGSVTPMTFEDVVRVAGGSAMLRRARIRSNRTSGATTNAFFRLHLYRVSPTVTNGDNGAWLSNQAANYIGAVDVVMSQQFSDGASGNGAPMVGSEILIDLPDGVTDIFGLLEARSAYAPGSAEQFTVSLEVIQN